MFSVIGQDRPDCKQPLLLSLSIRQLITQRNKTFHCNTSKSRFRLKSRRNQTICLTLSQKDFMHRCCYSLHTHTFPSVWKMQNIKCLHSSLGARSQQTVPFHHWMRCLMPAPVIIPQNESSCGPCLPSHDKLYS